MHILVEASFNLTGKILEVQTPWDLSKAHIVVSKYSFDSYDKERLLAGRCFNGICKSGWTFLLSSRSKGYIKGAYCWPCAELKLLRSLLSGFPIGDFWVIEKGKLKKGDSWLRDTTELFERYNKRVIVNDVKNSY